MNEAMFLATMMDVLKYDSKFKDKKDTLLPILRRCYVNSLPQYEFVRYGRSGQRYENVEIRVPVPMLDAANALHDDIYDLVNYVYEETDVMHGSYNWTKTANFIDETLATALDRDFVKKFADEFIRLYNSWTAPTAATSA